MTTLDFIEGTIDENVCYRYDVESDVLSLRVAPGDEANAVAQASEVGDVWVRDRDSGALVGLTVTNWWRRFGRGQLSDSIRSLALEIAPWATFLATAIQRDANESSDAPTIPKESNRTTSPDFPAIGGRPITSGWLCANCAASFSLADKNFDWQGTRVCELCALRLFIAKYWAASNKLQEELEHALRVISNLRSANARLGSDWRSFGSPTDLLQSTASASPQAWPSISSTHHSLSTVATATTTSFAASGRQSYAGYGVTVNGYRKRNGTYVFSHHRAAPGFGSRQRYKW